MHGTHSVPPCRRPSWAKAGRTPAAILLVALLALACPPVRAEAGAHEREPRLILPGERLVRPGEWIDLKWTEAEHVLELEILLSVDGGRTYPICISPQLDPDRHGFLWQVPDLQGAHLTMRIRYNVGGREIEGAPTGPLTIERGNRGHPQPLGLPPLAGPADPRSPRSPESQAPAGRALLRTAADAGAYASFRAAVTRSRAPVQAPRSSGTARRVAPFTPPRSLPLRV